LLNRRKEGKARSKQAGSQSKVKPNMLKCGQDQEQEQDFHPAKAKDEAMGDESWMRTMPQFNMQRQAILKYLKDIMLLRTHYTADCGQDGYQNGAGQTPLK